MTQVAVSWRVCLFIPLTRPPVRAAYGTALLLQAKARAA